MQHGLYTRKPPSISSNSAKSKRIRLLFEHQYTEDIRKNCADFGWDTLVAATGTAISYSADTFTLAQGKYLISWGEYLVADDATDKETKE